MNENTKKLADLLAKNHINYLCIMAGRQTIIGDIDRAVRDFTASFLSDIDKTIEAVKLLKTEKAWVSAGNHNMTVTTWDKFYALCCAA